MDLLKVGGKGKKKIKSNITNTLGIGKEKYKVEFKFTLKGVQNLSTEAGVGVFVTWKRGKRNGTSKTAFTSNNKSISLNDSFSFPASFLCDTSTKKFEPKTLKIQLNETKNKKTFAKLEINVTDYIEYALGKDLQLNFQSKGTPPSLLLYWQTTILKIGNKKIEKVERLSSSSPSTLSPSLSAPSSGMTNLLPSQTPRTPSQIDRAVPTLFAEAGRSRTSRVFGGLEFVLGDTDEASSDPTYSKSDDDDDDDLFSDIINSDPFNNDNNNNNNNSLNSSKEISEEGSELTLSTGESVTILVGEEKESNSALSQSNEVNINNSGHHEKKSDRKSSSSSGENNKDSSDKPHRKEKNHSKDKEKEKEKELRESKETREPKDREKAKEKADKEKEKEKELRESKEKEKDPKENKEKEGKERKEKEVKEKDVENSPSKEELSLTTSQEKSHKKEKNHSKDKDKEKELRESKEPKDREKVKEKGDKEKELRESKEKEKEKDLRESSKELKERVHKELRDSHRDKGEKEHKVKEKGDKEIRESKEKKVKGDENASNNDLKIDQSENEKSEQKLRRETFDPALIKEFRKVDKSLSGGSSSPSRRETTDLSSIMPTISITKADKVENNRDSGSGISMKNITSNINTLGNNITSNINTLGSNITSNINNILNPISPRKPKKENKEKTKKIINNNGEEEEIKELNKYSSDLLLPVQSQNSDKSNRSTNRNSSEPVVKKNSITHSDLPVIHIEKERKEKKEKEEKKEGGAKKKELSVSFQFEEGKKEKLVREKSEENVHPFKSYGIDAVNQLKQLQIQHAELQQKYQIKKKKLSDLKKGNLSQLPNVPSISLSSSSTTLSDGDEEEDEDQQLMVLHTQRLAEYMAKVFLFLLSLLLLANIF